MATIGTQVRPRAGFFMSGTTGVRLGAIALAALVTGLAGCGGSDSGNSTAPVATTTTARSGAVELDQFLMRTDEEPGFRLGAAPGATPRSRTTITGVDAFVKEYQLAPADEQRLRSEGFISYTATPIRGPRTAGVSNVALYATAAGAAHSLAHDLRAATIRSFGPVEGLRFFTVSGVPGARGWTASTPHVGNVSWVQGRCYLTLGNQGPGPFAGPLSTAVRAIYARTNGQCP